VTMGVAGMVGAGLAGTLRASPADASGGAITPDAVVVTGFVVIDRVAEAHEIESGSGRYAHPARARRSRAEESGRSVHRLCRSSGRSNVHCRTGDAAALDAGVYCADCLGLGHCHLESRTALHRPRLELGWPPVVRRVWTRELLHLRCGRDDETVRRQHARRYRELVEPGWSAA
jgi:hypothetical protein